MTARKLLLSALSEQSLCPFVATITILALSFKHAATVPQCDMLYNTCKGDLQKFTRRRLQRSQMKSKLVKSRIHGIYLQPKKQLFPFLYMLRGANEGSRGEAWASTTLCISKGTVTQRRLRRARATVDAAEYARKGMPAAMRSRAVIFIGPRARRAAPKTVEES